MGFSPVFGRPIPPPFGPAVSAAGAQLILHDTFTDANDTLLPAHTIAPVRPGTVSWVNIYGAWDIQSNQANNATNLFSNTETVCDPGISNLQVDADILFPVNNIMGIVFRYGPAAHVDFWFAFFSGTTIYLYEYPGGTDRGSYNLGALGAGFHTLSATANGTALGVSVDSIVRITYTSAVNLTYTRVGLYSYTAVANSHKVDNFKVYAL